MSTLMFPSEGGQFRAPIERYQTIELRTHYERRKSKKEQGELANKNTSKARREEITKDDWELTDDQICL